MKNKHLILLWVETDEDVDPSGIDWGARLEGTGLRLQPATDDGDSVGVKSFPWGEDPPVCHEVTWWITKPLTLNEWSDLDDAECKAIGAIVGDNFVGTAGPIPFGEEWEEARREWDAKHST